MPGGGSTSPCRREWCLLRRTTRPASQAGLPGDRCRYGGLQPVAVSLVLMLGTDGEAHLSPRLGYLRFGCCNDGLGGKAEFALQFLQRRRRPKGLHANGVAC